jgi:hypothetical protein
MTHFVIPRGYRSLKSDPGRVNVHSLCFCIYGPIRVFNCRNDVDAATPGYGGSSFSFSIL